MKECNCKIFCKKCQPELYKSPTGKEVPECRTCLFPAKYRGNIGADNEGELINWPVCDSHAPYLMAAGNLGEEFD